MADADRVRAYLRAQGEASWTGPDNVRHVEAVAEEMARLRREHPDGDYPAPIHGLDDVGACVSCDALRVFWRDLESVER